MRGRNTGSNISSDFVNALYCKASSHITVRCRSFVFMLLTVMFVFGSGVWSNAAIAGNNAGAAFNIWPDTGQTKCYDDNGTEINCPSEGEPFYGQDAQYQGPKRSYTKLGSGGVELPDNATIADGWIMTRDNVTGLIWEIKTDDGTIHDKDNTYTWCDSNSSTNGGDAGTCGNSANTEDFINTLNNENFGGYNDWRLPTIKELSTLINSGVTSWPSIDTLYFPNTMSSRYWSSTPDSYSKYGAWLVYFSHGRVNSFIKYGDNYVRAVRSRQDRLLDNLVDNHDGTITDTTTGLMWQKCSMGQTYNSATNGCDGSAITYIWKQALAECESLELVGYSDWRLPNRNELRSIVDYSKFGPSTDTNFSNGILSYAYWSATTHAYYPDDAWGVNFGYGNDYWGSKSVSDYVRCVRGGLSGSSGNLNLGDVSGDGKIDIVDALFVARYAVKLPVSNFNAKAADVNCDGKVDIVDALLIARKTVGLPVPAWCGSGK